jgi:hypothetical protein
MLDKTFKALWKEQFTPFLHRHLPQTATLIETADKLDSALGFLGTLSNDVEAEREQGLFVATLAIRYAMLTLAHFGLLDDDPTFPPPINLTQAKQALTNLLATLREHVRLGRMAVGEPGGADVSLGDAERDPAEPDSAPTDAKHVIDRATFTVRYGDLVCFLGPLKPFQLLERLHRAKGNYIDIATLLRDVWGDDLVSKGTVQKTISNLRKKLAEDGLGERFVIEAEIDHYRLLLR